MATKTDTPKQSDSRSPATNRRSIKPYQVTSVEKADTPKTVDGRRWYRYVISNEASTITGQRSGTLKQVTDHATMFAEQLNHRALNTSLTVYALRRKTPVSPSKP